MATVRDRLITSSLELFRRDGYQSTGIHDVLKASGCAKASLYEHFDNKEALLLAAMELHNERMLALFTTAGRACEPGPDAIRSIMRAVDARIRAQDFDGCMFIKMSSEFGDDGHPARRASTDHKSALREVIASCTGLDDAEAAGRFADQLMCIIDGAGVTKVVRGAETITASLELAELLIEKHLDESAPRGG